MKRQMKRGLWFLLSFFMVTFISLVLSILLFALMSVPVLAVYHVQQADIPTFDAWLKAASGPLVSVIVGLVLSWLVGWWPAYNDWETRYKRLVYGGLCIVLPVAAASLRAALGYVSWSFDPLIWHALWHGFAAALTGTVDYHARKSHIANRDLAGKKMLQARGPKDKPYSVKRKL